MTPADEDDMIIDRVLLHPQLEIEIDCVSDSQNGYRREGTGIFVSLGSGQAEVEHEANSHAVVQSRSKLASPQISEVAG